MFIFFDIGGTRTRVASAKNTDSFGEPVVFLTPQNYAEGIEVLCKTIEDLAGDDKVDYIIGGIAGPWSQKENTLLQSRNLPDWVLKPLQKDLADRFQSTVIIDNDSAMVGMGEAQFGAGKGFSIVAYITVSTGVGGARIVDGQVDEHSAGFEPGKQIMNDEGETLEDLVSGMAVEIKTGKKAQDIHDDEYWDAMAKILARGLHNTIVTWSPNVVVLGGAMIGGEYAIPYGAVEKHLREYTKEYPEVPPLKPSELKDFGGLYGALAVLKRNLQ